MFILLEGPDCAGKTTLAKKLLERMPEGTQYLHRGPIPADRTSAQEYIDPLLSYVPDGKMNIIADRWHLGELIYGSVKRNWVQLPEYQVSLIENLLIHRGVTNVILLPSVGEVMQRYKARGDSFLSEKELFTVWFRYATVARVLRERYSEFSHWLMWDGKPENGDEDKDLVSLLETAKETEEMSWNSSSKTA
jgi:hypothetical protein